MDSSTKEGTEPGSEVWAPCDPPSVVLVCPLFEGRLGDQVTLWFLISSGLWAALSTGRGMHGAQVGTLPCSIC